MNETLDGIQRRTFLAASAAVGAAAMTGTASASVLKSPLKSGDRLGNGWTVGTLDGDHAGALVIELVAPDQGTLRVLATRAGGGNALAGTAEVDLVLINAGEGQRPTPSDHVAVVRQLAERISGVEDKLPGASSMLTSAERQARFHPIDH